MDDVPSRSKRPRIRKLCNISDRTALRVLATADRGYFPDLNLWVAYKVEGVSHACVIADSRFIPLRTPSDDIYQAARGYPWMWQIADLRPAEPAPAEPAPAEPAPAAAAVSKRSGGSIRLPKPVYDASTKIVTNAVPVGVVVFLSRVIDSETLYLHLCRLGSRLEFRGRALFGVPFFCTGGNRGSIDAHVDGKLWKVARQRDALPHICNTRFVHGKMLSAWITLVREVMPEVDDWMEDHHILSGKGPYELRHHPTTLEYEVRPIPEVEMDYVTAWNAASRGLDRAISSRRTATVVRARRLAARLVKKADAHLLSLSSGSTNGHVSDHVVVDDDGSDSREEEDKSEPASSTSCSSSAAGSASEPESEHESA